MTPAHNPMSEGEKGEPVCGRERCERGGLTQRWHLRETVRERETEAWPESGTRCVCAFAMHAGSSRMELVLRLPGSPAQ